MRRRGGWFRRVGERGRRILAGALLASLLAVEVFSVAEIVHAAGHECSGRDCPVCALVAQCAENLQLLGSGLASAPPRVAQTPAGPTPLPARVARHVVHQTPVSLKIRLNL